MFFDRKLHEEPETKIDFTEDERDSVMIVVVMGVSGSGKTTVGSMLAHAMKCSFLEGDSLHSKENVEKMSDGIPLNDADRAPWLAAIRTRILDFIQRQESLVVVALSSPTSHCLSASLSNRC